MHGAQIFVTWRIPVIVLYVVTLDPRGTATIQLHRRIQRLKQEIGAEAGIPKRELQLLNGEISGSGHIVLGFAHAPPAGA
jgi:hypothetical protein